LIPALETTMSVPDWVGLVSWVAITLTVQKAFGWRVRGQLLLTIAKLFPTVAILVLQR
jgi:hypothetical protein